MNKKLISLLLITILAISAIAVFAGCDPNQEKNPPIEEQPTPQDPTEGGMAMLPESNGQGMRLLSTRILRPQFEEEGINPLAESAQQLTAVVTPADAEDKVVDWSIEWNNASSTWAKDKTVTDYVTVTPTSNGALTANVTCLQAFAEKIVVKVTLHSDTGLYATATVDYEKRVLGFDFSYKTSGIDWSMTTANLNPVVDFPVMKAADGDFFHENWYELYAENARISIVPHYSIYTVDKSYDSLHIEVAASAEYLQALSAAGMNVSATAGQFNPIYEDTINGNAIFIIDDLMFDTFGAYLPDSYNTYTALRSAIRANVNSTMLQIKVAYNLGEDDRDAVTIYNLKFSPESVSPIVENITLNPGSIKF